MSARVFPTLSALVIAGIATSTMGLGGQPQPAATSSASAAPAKELAELMAAKKLTTIAARDPAEAGRYVAALIVPSVEMLVVSAKADTTALDYRLYHQAYADAYADINAAPAASKIFVTDQKADGLVARPPKDAPLDSIVQGGQEFAFDGDPKKLKAQKMAPPDFDKRFADADQVYAHMLSLLIAELKK